MSGIPAMISINQKWCQKGNEFKISDEKFLFFSFDFGFFAQIKIIFNYFIINLQLILVV